MSKPRVLVVDDERQTVRYVSANLRARGFEVLPAQDGSEALKLITESILDLIILDISMPGPDGLQVCKAVREWSSVPIIMLTAHGNEADKVRALDLGADDYLTKPFGIEELMARVRAVLRRAGRQETSQRLPVRTPDLAIDFGRRRVVAAGKEVTLTPTEYRLLQELVINAGKVLTHNHLLQTVWGPEYLDQTDYLWAYIRRLRRKLEPDPHEPHYILTQPGVGYLFKGD